MRKRVLSLALAGGLVFGGFSLSGAIANDCGPQDLDPSDGTVSVQTDAGGVCGSGDAGSQTGHLWADGNDDNPDPIDGYVSAGNDGASANDGDICADDNGGPEDGGDSPTCASDATG